MDYFRGGLWKCKCRQELRTRATEQIIEAIDQKLCGQFKCEKRNMETKVIFWCYSTLLPTPLSTYSPSHFIHIRPHAFTSSSPLLPSLPGKFCSGMFSAADMNNGTIASVLLEGAPRQFALIVLKLPGRENHLFCLML